MKQFLSISEAAEELGTSEQYIRNLIRGIQTNTPKRYTVSDVFNGGKVAVRFVALQDYARYRDRIDTAPPYDPVRREAELGITEGQAYLVNISAHDIALELFRMFAQTAGGAT